MKKNRFNRWRYRRSCYPQYCTPSRIKRGRIFPEAGGDQLLNAASFEAQGFSMKLLEEDLTTDKLIEMVHELFHDRVKYVDAMNACTQQDAITSIINLINDFS